MDQIPEQALAWHQAGKGAALATVVETWGSAPRRVGAMLAVSGEGELAGSVSGGCVEGAVITEAFDAIDSGRSAVLTYGVSDDDAFAVGLACGGTIRILLQPVGFPQGLPVDTLEDLCAARAARTPVAHVVDTADWSGRLAGRDDFTDRFRADRSGFLEDGATFVAIHNPPLRMTIVGAVHIAQALVPMARLAGYDPLIIDPRPAFAAGSRFPGETIRDAYPDEVLADIAPDTRTALVLLTHDPKIDDPALEIGLRSEAFYIGALGSTRTHAKRVTRLEEKGFTGAEIDRIHAPVGLDIGAAGPAEIAVAIMAEITQVLRKGA
ncbi:XdhC/CoxI family protein [Pseudooceanicola batsensis HTCC2597]|uniref:XdhC/CoxI family protein n=1 Tax=Pseudooceanicola batsensis (strain ATCC BAA-863 / DSM 15984 / KCTC 12145 / HTCC2597) TaxID=252305 RepID=A3U1T2_PSEBH|nr:XdhC family protein [Pseudooceanicola batsensis]EAQ01866.1 XdhC/CoxI family protein [Pseudooceanicola batsensis HTCC2597]